jgi:hypothetical protein
VFVREIERGRERLAILGSSCQDFLKKEEERSISLMDYGGHWLLLKFQDFMLQ